MRRHIYLIVKWSNNAHSTPSYPILRNLAVAGGQFATKAEAQSELEKQFKIDKEAFSNVTDNGYSDDEIDEMLSKTEKGYCLGDDNNHVYEAKIIEI